MRITVDGVIRGLDCIAAQIHEQRDYLTALDATIGDADHGINLDRGFSMVQNRLTSLQHEQDIGAVLRHTGQILLSTVGGASGALYATAFRRAGTVLNGSATIGSAELLIGLQAALDGIVALGHARHGDKTMVDTIAPCVAALRTAQEAGEPLPVLVHRSVRAAREGIRATIPMQAQKGRAAFLNERSIGHQDPGATSAYYILRGLLELLSPDGAADIAQDANA
jgi:dihydroxyacetone kinase-like protein